MAEQNAAAEVRQALVDVAGGFLRSARWESPLTCTYCAGIPGSAVHATCYYCGREFEHNAETSDRRGFVTYAWPGSQTARVMYGYKATAPDQQAVRVVRLALAYTLWKHLHCTTHPEHGPVTHWATVPSLKNRGRPQALNEYAAGLIRSVPQARISAAEDVTDPRGFVPENFAIQDDLTGAHVLLLDDTWASGHHAESACIALKRAGARCVTVLVLARWIEPSWAETGKFIKSELTEDFDPDQCPFGGSCA